MVKRARNVIRRRKTRCPIQDPRNMASAVADLFGACRRRAYLAERTGDEKAKHAWLQLAQIGDCTVEWILPLLQDDMQNAVLESGFSGRHRCKLKSRRNTPRIERRK